MFACSPGCPCWPRPGGLTSQELGILVMLQQAEGVDLNMGCSAAKERAVEHVVQLACEVLPPQRLGYVLSVPMMVGTLTRPTTLLARHIRSNHLVPLILRCGVCANTGYGSSGHPWLLYNGRHPGRLMGSALLPLGRMYSLATYHGYRVGCACAVCALCAHGACPDWQFGNGKMRQQLMLMWRRWHARPARRKWAALTLG
jgi:hypothetical protein